MPDPDRIAATLSGIKEREQAATKGRWVADVIPSLRDRPVILLSDPDNDDAADLLFRADSPQATEADAEFIAHAREDVPSLVAAVERVLKLADEAKATGTTVCDCLKCSAARQNGFTGIHRLQPYMWNLDPAKVREAIAAELAKGEAGDGR